MQDAKSVREYTLINKAVVSLLIYIFPVALNYQTDDKSNFFNHALFSSNGNCGYVLKPAFLREPNTGYNPLSPSGLSAKRVGSKKLKLQVTH